MKVEKFEGILRINPSSSGGKVVDDSYDESDMPLLRFDLYDRPFLLLEKYCDNPGCNCKAASLVIMEIDETGKTIDNPMRFLLHLDLKTWKEIEKPERPDVVQDLVDEFIKSLPDKLKIRFKIRYEKAKEKARSAVMFTMPLTDLYGGVMASYTEVFNKTGSMRYGGDGAGFEFEFKGKQYWIEDLYCINPYCDCDEICLVFLEFSEKKRIISELFNVFLSLKRKKGNVDGHPRCTKEVAQKVFEQWQQSEPDVVGEIINRQKEMKKVGQRLISKYHKSSLPLPIDYIGKKKKYHHKESKQIRREMTTKSNKPKYSQRSSIVGKKRKIGRNDPCPCGTGLKYKKCCGRPTR